MAAALPVLAGAVAAPATATLGLGALGAGAGALGTMGAVAANPLIGSLAGGALLGSAVPAANMIPAALSSTSPAFVGPKMFMGPQAPTLGQSIMNTGQNIYGLMGENPGLTNVAMSAGSSMLQPEPPPQVLQAPSIQGGQFAPVDFMSLLSQQPQQMPRRTSLLG